MAKKKTDEIEETSAQTNEAETTDQTAADQGEVAADAAAAEMIDAPVEEQTEKTTTGDKSAETSIAADAAPSLLDSIVDTVSAAVSTVAEAVVGGVEKTVAAVTTSDNAGADGDEGTTTKTSKRAEKVGIVASDKMTKTVTVRVDRLVKHPIYRKFIKRRKKFMAHDDLGAGVGDKVRIVETRPLSAKKRWRVVEIIQKAER